MDTKINNSKYKLPDNMGRMNEPYGAAWIKGVCGDTMEMYLMIENDTVTDSKFYTDGCEHSIICGSIAAKLASGRKIMDVLKISPGQVIDNIKDLPPDSIHCSILAVNTLHKAIADFLIRRV